MGGLVARAFLVEHVIESGNEDVDTFVTLATPWGGHKAAASGVEMAPRVVPSWHDLAPGSPFLSSLFEERLAGRVDHHLIFSFRGSNKFYLASSNDGAVTVASQLREEAQADAVGLYGVDATHVGILHDIHVVERVERILGGAS